MPYQAHHTTQSYLEQVKKHTEPYKAEVLGKEMIVYPNVMSPKYDWSSRFHAENMPDQKGKSFLEIGCGCGILSLFAALQGAKRIFAVDINPNAVENAKENLSKYGVKDFEVHYSDVFENVEGTFDTINFAAPYHGNKPNEILEYGVSDPEYSALKIFLHDARKHLNKHGQLVLGFSSTGDADLLNELIIENKWLIKDFKEESNYDWKAYLYVLEAIEFKNKTQEFIYEDEYSWFKKYVGEVRDGKILKVGYGLGYLSYFIKLYNPNITSIDIQVDAEAINPDGVKIYDGDNIPFSDREFEVVICTYTLHHTPNPSKLFSEIVRVSSSGIVIIEETWRTFFQRLQEIWNCWLVNLKAGQKVKIFWKSYFSAQSVRKLFIDYNIKIEKQFNAPRRSFLVEIFILKK